MKLKSVFFGHLGIVELYFCKGVDGDEWEGRLINNDIPASWFKAMLCDDFGKLICVGEEIGEVSAIEAVYVKYAATLAAKDWQTVKQNKGIKENV